MISIKRFGFNFINIPKNASTSVRRFFIDNVVQPEDSFSNYYDELNIPHSQNMSPKHADHSHMDVEYVIKHRLAHETDRFIGIIRNPLERVVSLFLYRQKQGFNKSLTAEDFKKIVTKHGYFPDRKWQNQLQSSFLTYKGQNIGEWWLFDDIQKHIDEFSETHNIQIKVPLMWKNKSLPKNRLTKDYLSWFYDDAALKAVNKYYEKDIEIYEGLKCSH